MAVAYEYMTSQQMRLLRHHAMTPATQRFLERQARRWPSGCTCSLTAAEIRQLHACNLSPSVRPLIDRMLASIEAAEAKGAARDAKTQAIIAETRRRLDAA